ncbi:MAG: TonB-dependent receptor [Gammaproteobacteria bacterium]|nr:TonB-dependent receptor [Gammaproteobacteria bacterium]
MKPIGTSILNLGGAVALGLVGLALATNAVAQDAQEDTSFLEEIVVTSKVKKGGQNIMDVPVAITAITGAQIEASGIKDMFDLQQNVPGLIVSRSQTATTSNFSVRGIGSTSNNFGVESSVGLYVDGTYRSRQSSMINELVDVEAVEVLRGPQGTLFGKNTAAGAINIRTVAPSTDSADAFMELTAGDLNLRRIAGAANIPLTDKLAFRGTIFASERDGYVDNYAYNLAAGPGEPFVSVQEDAFNDRDRLGLRAQLGYDNGDDFDLRIIGDYSEIDEVCCVGTNRVDNLFSHGGIDAGIGIPGTDFVRMSLGSIVFTDFDYPDFLPTAPFLGVDIPRPPNVIQGVSWGDFITSVNEAPRSENTDMGLSVEFNKDFSNGATLTSVTAIRAFDTFDFIDVDFTDTDMAVRTNDAEQDSISQELRLAGSFGEDSRWVVGAYYFAQDIKSRTVTTAGTQLQAFADVGQAAAGQPTLSDVTNGVTAISLATGGAIPLGAPAIPVGMFADDRVLQEHDGIAVFGQVDWALSESLELSLGARYTDETKDIAATYTQTNPGTGGPPDLTAIGTTFFLFEQWALGGQVGPPPDLTPLLAVAQPNAGWFAWTLAPFAPRADVLDSIEDDQVTGTAKLTWFANDSMMFYGSYSTGFKSGGTNTDRIFEFLPQTFNAETSNSAEIGFKGDLGDRFRLAASIYQTDFEDFQANSFTGTGFNLRNAGDLEVKGLEIEYLWQVMDNTSISGYYAHNEGEFISFEGATCQDAYPFHTLSQDPGFDPVTGACNRNGETIPYNPEDRFNIGITQNIPMNSGEMFLRVEYAWTSEYTTDGDNDPLTIQDDFGILNLRVGVDLYDWNSTITLWGRNVTDERYYTASFDPPLQDPGRMNSYPSEPATYGLTFRKNWD